MCRRSVALPFPLVAALVLGAVAPATALDDAGASPSPDPAGLTSDSAVEAADVAWIDLADRPTGPEPLPLAESPNGSPDDFDPGQAITDMDGATALLFPYAEELAAMDQALAPLLEIIPAVGALEDRLLERWAAELSEQGRGPFGFVSARLGESDPGGRLPPAAEASAGGAGFDGSLLGVQLTGMSNGASQFGEDRSVEASKTLEDGTDISLGIEAGPSGVGMSSSVSQGETAMGSRWKGRLEGDPCPDANGNVTATLELTIADTARAGSGVQGSVTTRIEGKATGSVNDAAALTAIDFSGTAARRAAYPGHASWVEAQVSGTASASDWGQPSGKVGVTRVSSQATGSERDKATDAAAEIYQVVASILGMWEQGWQSGRCVKIDANVPSRVPPSSKHTFDVRVVHRDGQQLDAPVEVTFSGTQSLEPRRIEHAPGKLTYGAGEKQGEMASVGLTSTSRRGIGKLQKSIEVEGYAYRMVGGADSLKVDDVVCDITKPFTVRGGRIRLDFTPNGNDYTSGTYTYHGNFGKFSLSGKGTYTLTRTDRGGTIVAKGRGNAKVPLGTYSNFGKEKYELTATSCD